MSRLNVLRELLARVGESRGKPVLLTTAEINLWPTGDVRALQSEKVLTRATPAKTAVCPGCEETCVMPIHTSLSGEGGARSFIACDRRSDVARVAVPLEHLEQWQVTGASVAALIARSLKLRQTETSKVSLGRWGLGVLKGRKHSAHALLVAEGGLTLRLAGHAVELTEVLTLEAGLIELDARALSQRIDNPVGGGGDAESAGQRRERLIKRVKEEKLRGTRAFLQKVANEEGIGVSRLKQLVGDRKDLAVQQSSKRSF